MCMLDVIRQSRGWFASAQRVVIYLGTFAVASKALGHRAASWEYGYWEDLASVHQRNIR
jgi:hypothetical protein